MKPVVTKQTSQLVFLVQPVDALHLQNNEGTVSFLLLLHKHLRLLQINEETIKAHKEISALHLANS